MNQVPDGLFITKQGEGRVESRGLFLTVSADFGRGGLDRNCTARTRYGIERQRPQAVRTEIDSFGPWIST
jgi:hypothetical protein